MNSVIKRLSSLPWSLANLTWNSVSTCLAWTVTLAAILSTALVSYWVFYALYLPTPHHSRTVYFKFSTHGYIPPEDLNQYGREEQMFPKAIVSLRSEDQNTVGDRILTRGQRYRVILELEVPDSAANRAIGMFMIDLDFQSKDKKIVASSSRPALIPFSSPIIARLSSLFDFFLLHYGFKTESRNMKLVFFESFMDDSYHPAEKARILIYCKDLQVFSAKLHIEAVFSGIRYFMFYWPVTSAILGILTNLSVCTILTIWLYFKCCKSYEADEEDLEESFVFTEDYLLGPSNNQSADGREELDEADNNDSQQQQQTTNSNPSTTRLLSRRHNRQRHVPLRRLQNANALRRRTSGTEPVVPLTRLVSRSSTGIRRRRDESCQTDSTVESEEPVETREAEFFDLQ